ncbi:MAG: GntR family transcriptional regulator [Chloroflexi bacterium]|nr:GntR family transcriptional regulator [Chloroflexota bacterium]
MPPRSPNSESALPLTPDPARSPVLRDYPHLTNDAYRRLRAAIIDFELAPGERLNERALAEQLGVSRTPLREALQRLYRDGLVVLIPRRGAFIARLSPTEVRDLCETNVALQSLLARCAAERGTPAEREALATHLADLEAAAAANDLTRWIQVDPLIHHTLWAMARNAYARQILENAEPKVGRLRRLCIREPGRLGESTLEHHRLVEAVIDGRPQEAEELARQHLQRFQEVALRALSWYENVSTNSPI